MISYSLQAYGLQSRGYKSQFEEVVKRLNPQRHEKILEVGCAQGVVVRALQDITWQTHGIDVSQEAISNGLAKNLHVMAADKLDFPSESFHKVYSFHTFEHIPNIKQALAEISRVLIPGGKVLLVYPAEPIRGLFAIGASLVIFKHPFKARQIHMHKLTPKKIQKLIVGTKLQHRESRFSLARGPEFFTVLQKEV